MLGQFIKSSGVYVLEGLYDCCWVGASGSGEHLNIVSCFQELLHSLNSQAVAYPRRVKDITQKEILMPPAPISKIEFLPSMIIYYIGEPDPLIEWKAGTASIQY